MGFLEAGTPLEWATSLPYVEKVKSDGITQLLEIWRLNVERQDSEDALRWGDELEFTLVHLDPAKKEAQLCVDGPELLEELCQREKVNDWDQHIAQTASVLTGAKKCFLRASDWHPEYGRHMVEATPSPPYDMTIDSFLDVEESMLSRRYKIQSILPDNVYATTLAAFPRLGLPDYTWSKHDQGLPNTDEPLSCGSRFIVHRMVNPHPRFPTLSMNVNHRRGCKISASVPVYEDHYTMDNMALWKDSLDPHEMTREAVAERSLVTDNPMKGRIYMDHFGFGMSMSCLQTTFGTMNLSSARYLYDQMSVLAPIFLSISAATPALRGLLADTDTRWNVLEQTCDCRSEAELAQLDRTRFGAVGAYISDCEYLKKHEQELNDVSLPVNASAYRQLKDSGMMDDLMAKHFASLWVRDPLVIFSDRIDLDPTKFVDHFENIQSTNWNSVRFKPPPNAGTGEPSHIGWRVELRTPDLQLSDLGNAAIACFSAILAMGILKERWNFYIPISKSHENMTTAHQRDSVIKSAFWFNPLVGTEGQEKASAIKMTLRDIFLGSRRTGFQGLLPLCDQFVSGQWRSHHCSRRAVEKYRLYANYIRSKVLGQAWTDARLMRQTIRVHANYERDSVVNPELNYEICRLAVLAGFGLCPQTASWGIPGCIPSSARLCNPVDLNTVLGLPLARQLIKVVKPLEEVQILQQEAEDEPSGAEEESVSYKSFDPALLQLEQCSR